MSSPKPRQPAWQQRQQPAPSQQRRPSPPRTGMKHNPVPATPAPLTEVRLQKALAERGLGSRREMEAWISAGRVLVNGTVATLGTKVTADDRVLVDNKPVKMRTPQGRLPRVMLYHKPEGEIVTHADPEGRANVFAHLPRMKTAKWLSIGRLDLNTCGLLVFTTSGELANRLMHPRFAIEREYAVRLLGELTHEQLQQLQRGITLEDGIAKFDQIFPVEGGEGVNRWYHVVLREGRNREVRRMFEHLGLTVSRLMRVRFGSIHLPPRLKRGQLQELNDDEVAALLTWAGLPVPSDEEAPAQRQRTKSPFTRR